MSFFKNHLLGIFIFSVTASLTATFIYEHFSLNAIAALLKPKAGDSNVSSTPHPPLAAPSGESPRVPARPGFLPGPMERKPVMEEPFGATGHEESGSIATAAMAAPFRLAGRDDAYVSVMIEVDGRGLLAGRQGNPLPVEVSVYAMDANGKVEDFLTQTFRLNLGKARVLLQQSGMKFFGHLDLQPGQYSLRTLVRNGATGSYGLRVISLEVPPFGQAGTVLLPPFFPEPGGKWLSVRETPRGEQKDVPYPFTFRGQPYIPAAMPVLGPGEEAQVSLVGYNLNTGDVQVQTQVQGVGGKEVASGEMRVIGQESGSGDGLDRLLAIFKAPNLQPGEYTLRVTLGGKPESSSAQFMIRGGATAARPEG